MTPENLVAVAGDGATVSDSFGTTTVDLAVNRWVVAALALRDDERTSFDYFDWLSAYDDKDAGLAVVARVWSTRNRAGVVLRTLVDRDNGQLPTLTTVWPGANWHERETFEMFGIGFDGHLDLAPLLLPDGFEGNPLRKEFVLATRVAKEWPGVKEPGGERPKRRAAMPPGVPDPGTWGPS